MTLPRTALSTIRTLGPLGDKTFQTTKFVWILIFKNNLLNFSILLTRLILKVKQITM
jgi:hypothetical protein